MGKSWKRVLISKIRGTALRPWIEKNSVFLEATNPTEENELKIAAKKAAAKKAEKAAAKKAEKAAAEKAEKAAAKKAAAKKAEKAAAEKAAAIKKAPLKPKVSRYKSTSKPKKSKKK